MPLESLPIFSWVLAKLAGSWRVSIEGGINEPQHMLVKRPPMHIAGTACKCHGEMTQGQTLGSRGDMVLVIFENSHEFLQF